MFIKVNLVSLVKGILNLPKSLDVKTLPSQGLFYANDFNIKIKRASVEDILDYEKNFIKDNIGIIITKVKKIVKKNIILSSNYVFEDIKSIDVIFIFLEIVKYTKDKSIDIKYFDEFTGTEETIQFSSEYFNYHFIEDSIMRYYDNKNKCFEIDGYKYSLPSIGIENSLTDFLIYHQNRPDSQKYNEYFYDFTYFLLGKTYLNFDEIENLIQIFNFDIEQEEADKIQNILKMFLPLQKYSLIKDGRVIDINSKVDLGKIWK